MQLKAVIFDFDGTLTKPGSIDFISIRKRIQCPEDQRLLEYINNLNDQLKKEALIQLDNFEYKAAEESIEEDYAEEIICFLQDENIPIFIISRNSKKSVERALENFTNISIKDFDEIISRDSSFPVKPDPTSILYIADKLNIESKEIVVIGDYIHDIDAGRNANATTIYKETGRIKKEKIESNYTINSLKELIPIISMFLR